MLRAMHPLLLFVTIALVVASVSGQENSAYESVEQTVPNGIYLVNRWTETKGDLMPLLSGEVLVEHDPAAVEPNSSEPVKYVTIVPANSVAFNQLKTVDPVTQDDGRMNLNLTLNEESAEDLERLSQQHLGRQVAIVIDGKAVTLHKIRGIIRDGKLQISRCTDDGCSVILKELVDN